MGVSRWAESREASHSDRMSRGKQGKMEETGKKGKIVENGETGETGGNRGKQRREILCRPLPQLWAILAFYCSLNARCTEENCYSMTTENKTNGCPGYTEPRTQIFDKNRLIRQSKTICFRFTQYVRERTWYVLYLDDARWLPMMRRVPRSILPRNPKKFLSLYFHRTREMRCPVIKMWPRQIIFSFSVSSTAFGFFILVKAASEGDRVLTEGGWWLKYTIACAANGRF